MYSGGKDEGLSTRPYERANARANISKNEPSVFNTTIYRTFSPLRVRFAHPAEAPGAKREHLTKTLSNDITCYQNRK